MGCFCDLVSGFGLRPNCMQMYTQFGSQLLRSATASSFLRGSSASMARGLQGCFCIAAKRGVYFWKIYIVLSERLWPSFFFLKYGLDNRICRGILLEIGHLNCRIKQMSHVTLQTNSRQAPTKRPATTAAGPKTKKAKVAKARVVST
jgi:hypothetical protein